MDDLTKCLYTFLCEKRMGSLYEDPEYQEMSFNTDRQLQRVEEGLSEEKRQALHLLLENLSARSSIECEHQFRAVLSLSRELNALVRA